ncbi:hypothetical protein ACL2XQ_02150 [Sodalis sp. RH14]|uniref:hypothetical protein n=1 Tax=Sodalis sp. RH14 TaxID=3394329 RepID=UPI0039B6E583
MPDPLLTGHVLGEAACLHAVDDGPPETPRFSLDHFILKTYVQPCRYGAYRFYHGMRWFEHADTASLSARIHFTRCLVDRIIAMDLPRQQPLTLISLGAGGLLAEYVISRLLTDKGFTHLRWRCIDVMYAHEDFADAIRVFRECTGSCIETFSTERAYLDPMAGAGAWAAGDRDDGAAIVLSMAPPAIAMKDLTPSQEKQLAGQVCMRGHITEELEEANCVNIIFALNNNIDSYYQELTAVLKGSNKLIWLNCILKCSVNDQGHYDMVSSADTYADVIYNRLTTQLHQLWKSARLRTAGAPGDAVPVLSLSQIIIAAGLLRTRWPPLRVIHKLFLFNDYDIALSGLRAFFRDGSRSTLFASFENNTAEFA